VTYPLDLYELMPAVYRREDVGLGYPLEALLDIISTEAGDLQRDIAGLWDDFFIETAQEWLIPYIADLIGSTPLHPVSGSWRADVANTIGYRRRKGTVAMLEDLAADVTGWPARVVPYFEQLEWAQHLDHLRRITADKPGRVDRVGTVDLGNFDALDRLGGAFDDVVRSVDIRPFGAGRGRHNIKKIGFFVWRLRSFPFVGVTPQRSGGQLRGYHFSPLGNAAPLFTNDRRRSAARPAEIDLPAPIRRVALLTDLNRAAASAAAAEADALASGATSAVAAAAGRAAGAISGYYGPDREHSVVIAVGDPAGDLADQAIPASRVTVCNLSVWRPPPTNKDAAIDPLLGRLTLAPAIAPTAGQQVRVSYSYGFNGAPDSNIGGGPYDRVPTVRPGVEDLAAAGTNSEFRATVARVTAGGAAFPSIGAAVAAWLAMPAPAQRAVVEIVDSGTYREGQLEIALPQDCTLEIRSTDRQRPVAIVTRLRVSGGGGSRIVFDGLAIAGNALRVGAGVEAVSLRHVTLVPGRVFNRRGVAANPATASIISTQNATGAVVTVANSILGPIRVPAEGWWITASDSIIDSPSDGPAITGLAGTFGPSCDLRRVTILGDVRVRSILYASDVLFVGDVNVERTQTGCIRFSYVDDTAVTPRRYRCQPDMALDGAASANVAQIRSRLRPRFTSRSYGQPGYAQLAVDAASELKTGGERESEIGSFSRVQEAQRIANLRIRLEEYLPAGLEPGLIFAT
jgi:hypothetical protein